jgi:hypothetical protein
MRRRRLLRRKNRDKANGDACNDNG